jgi:hypothetical protein
MTAYRSVTPPAVAAANPPGIRETVETGSGTPSRTVAADRPSGDAVNAWTTTGEALETTL